MIWIAGILYLCGYLLMLALLEDPCVTPFPGITDYAVSILWPFISLWWLGLRIVRKIKNNRQ